MLSKSYFYSYVCYNLAICAKLRELSKNMTIGREDLPFTSVFQFILSCSMYITLTAETLLTFVHWNFFVSLQWDYGCLKCLLMLIDKFSCEGLQDDPFWTQNKPSRHLGDKRLCITSWDPNWASWTLQGLSTSVSSLQLCMHFAQYIIAYKIQTKLEGEWSLNTIHRWHI